MIIDSANIIVRSGRGGDGCVSFRREKYVAKGGPDGGNGGNGGSVILVADPEVETLMDFSGRHHWYAKSGQPGGGKQCTGKNADDLYLRLPVGTLIYDNTEDPEAPPVPAQPDEDDPDYVLEQIFFTGQERAAIHAPDPDSKPTGELLVDLSTPGQEYVIAKGGKGGLGNEHFKSATHQVPREFTPGEPAEEKLLRLELKLIADVGLLGKPNAGKSTLLSAISKAEPKIADYPFTTLKPQLGIAELKGGRRLVVADIPGLIENAHQGSGLGIRFLRHVERTKLLIHVLELEPTDRSDPIENYRVIRNELEQHSEELAGKTEIIALSKMDLYGGEEDRQVAIDLIESALGKPVFPISSATREGVAELLESCWQQLDKTHRTETGQGWEVRPS